MELRHLRYFLAVAEARQFTRAAARLHIQQPPLSQQIHELEHELGFALFRRLPRGVEFTAAGAEFAQGVRAVFDTLEKSIAQSRRVASGDVGMIRVALTGSAAFHPLPPAAIRAFRILHPGITIELTESSASEIVASLLAGRLDAAIVRKPRESTLPLRFDLLQEEPIMLVLPLDHPLLVGDDWPDIIDATQRVSPVIPLAALEHETFLLVRRPGTIGMYAEFIDACESVGFTPHIAMELSQMQSAINLVATGAGVTLVPASMQRYRQESVVYCEIAWEHTFTVPLHLVTRDSMVGAEGAASPAAKVFAETILGFAAPTLPPDAVGAAGAVGALGDVRA